MFQNLKPEISPDRARIARGGKTLLIVAVVAVVVSVGGIFLLKTMEPAPSPQPQTLDTSDWQTYRTSEEKTRSPIEYSGERTPRLEEFSISEQFKGVPASVDLSSHPDAPRFKTVLTEGAKAGPNFAGYYTIISWGCGTECQVIAVVNAKTGTVYFPPFVTALGSEFRVNSSLFIVNPPNIIEEVYGGYKIPDWVYSAYYKWENNQFVSIYDTRIATQTTLPATCKDETEGMPVITFLSSTSGPVGTKLEIRGCNFSGFEGDKNAWIENAQGVKGILYGKGGSTSKLLKLTLSSPLCQIDTSYSGLPCDAYLTLTPGTYKIYTAPWKQQSNKINFTVNNY